MFGRKSRDRARAEAVEAVAPLAPARLDEDAEIWNEPGPRSVEEVDTSVGYVDMGSIRIPAVKGMQLRTQVADDGASVLRVLIVLGDSGLQISAAAAPRSGGVWDEVRAKIAEGIGADGGAVEAVEGRYGVELRADIPVTMPDGRAASSRMRIIGREGPRWFSRIDILGPAALNDEAGREIERIIDRIVIVRDDQPRARLDLLPVHVPDAAVEAPHV
ncbi:DUF3710 domain-containing protein [Schaalia hyovaginalis]|uniref:DUF3710 domain-containing protein n=1 Tax=Schaalia hyovaginalis TaxID=29316 RepID=UPI001F41E6BD|nr:DUF3710 domain-containing protein [Schaalia hyovaginalis]MCF2711851.1 DUF3710 domain-containing protein [Schaalia hyovaginalis]